MRLLDSRTLELISFDTPPKGYAILSHRWDKEEVSFQDVQNGTAQGKPAFYKIQAFCHLAAEDGFQYCWADTCCIDKTSSAELSEAINSMYAWYQKADVCYAYLADVSSAELLTESQWFDRGWTLQELVAPKHVGFYSANWTFIGSKNSLWDVLVYKTRISKDILLGRQDIESATVAQRMSWAAYRKTTREEDIAYSLLGIFDVNMPLLYGEGKKAFRRLQEAILTNSDDHSILAWKGSFYGCGGLASTPFDFRSSGNVVSYFEMQRDESLPWSMTNLGLRVQLPIYEPGHHEKLYKSGTCIAILNCSFERQYTGPMAIRLQGPSNRYKDQYSRGEDIDELIDLEIVHKATLRTIYIHEDKWRAPTQKPTFLIRKRPDVSTGYSFQEVYPPKHFDDSRMIIKSPCFTAVITFAKSDDDFFVVLVGTCWCRVFNQRDIPMTQQPLIEARRLIQDYRNEVINRVHDWRYLSASQSIPSEQMRQYASQCQAMPEINGHPAKTSVPDYERLISQSRLASWDMGDTEHATFIAKGVLASAKIDRLDIMGELIMVVDVSIVQEARDMMHKVGWNPYDFQQQVQYVAQELPPGFVPYQPQTMPSNYVSSSMPPAELPG